MSLVEFNAISPEVLQITLNDPDSLNAMGEGMAAEFVAGVRAAKEKHTKLRAVVITGAGRAFSAGGNLEMLEKKSLLAGEENRLRMLDFYHSFLSIQDFGVPCIAALNGHAIGAGLCLASACEVRICSESAKLGFTFAKLGLHPGMGATYFLPRVIGPTAAAELMVTGRVIDAAEALRIGLVSKICPTDEVLSTAMTIAEEVSSCGPEAVRQLCQSLRTPAATLEECLAREALCQSINYSSSEFKEGVRAVSEKRPAKF